MQSARIWNKRFRLSSYEEKCLDNKCLFYTSTYAQISIVNLY